MDMAVCCYWMCACISIEGPIQLQVQRLIAVLSVPSIGRSALLQDAALRLPMELPEQDMAVLRQAGWTEENGLRALLNFSGAAQYWTSRNFSDHSGDP